MQKVVIVIPIYKKDLSENETASLIQCIKILGNYDIKFICPESLNTKQYEQIMQSSGLNFNAQRFEDNYFISLNSYSKLLLNKEFYKKFNNYEFMLIYQLDAWVFEDSLLYWCDQDYDYIGAPWFEGFGNATKTSPMMKKAGNGGLSLRRISSLVNLLSINYRDIKSFKQIYDKNKKKQLISNIINFPLFLIKFIFQKEFFNIFWETTTKNEDLAIATVGPKVYSKFKVAPPNIALNFSFEVQPERLYQMNNKNLPFGCHAFEKYEKDFWKQFINFT